MVPAGLVEGKAALVEGGIKKVAAKKLLLAVAYCF